MSDQLLDSLAFIARHCWREAIWKKTPKGPRHFKTPLTFDHLRAHLDGTGPAIGLAPITPGTSVTRVGLLDLDDHTKTLPPEKMELAIGRVVGMLQAMSYAPVVFRSSGGRGAHVYLFWKEPQEARDVRKLLAEALIECNLKPGTKGIEHGECEAFPKQNEVPIAGAGSMWILPFAKHSELLAPCVEESM